MKKVEYLGVSVFIMAMVYNPLAIAMPPIDGASVKDVAGNIQSKLKSLEFQGSGYTATISVVPGVDVARLLSDEVKAAADAEAFFKRFDAQRVVLYPKALVRLTISNTMTGPISAPQSEGNPLPRTIPQGYLEVSPHWDWNIKLNRNQSFSEEDVYPSIYGLTGYLLAKSGSAGYYDMYNDFVCDFDGAAKNGGSYSGYIAGPIGYYGIKAVCYSAKCLVNLVSYFLH